MKSKVYIESGKIWAVEGHNRIAFDDFQEVLDYLAKCCGVSCCERLVRLKDKVTHDTNTLYFENGALKTKNEVTGVVKTVTLT